MNRERFEKLIDAVERAPDEQFDMGGWVAADGECGTVACACGHYAIRYGKDEGLCPCPQAYCVTDRDGIELTLLGWADHFGIGYAEAERLFLSSSYSLDITDDGPTRAEVLARLKQFYADHLPAGATV